MQTVVQTDPVIGSPGDLADLATGTDGEIVSAVNAEATDTLVVGTMCKRGTGERTALRLAAQADKATAHGIVTRAHHFSDLELVKTTIDDAVLDSLTPGTMFGVGRSSGYVVIIEEDVDVGDPVRVRCVAGATEIAGAFRTTQDSTDCILLPTDAFYWVKGGVVDPDTGWGVAVCHIDMNHIARAASDA